MWTCMSVHACMCVFIIMCVHVGVIQCLCMYICTYLHICVHMCVKYVMCRRKSYPALGIRVHTTVDRLLFVLQMMAAQCRYKLIARNRGLGGWRYVCTVLHKGALAHTRLPCFEAVHRRYGCFSSAIVHCFTVKLVQVMYRVSEQMMERTIKQTSTSQERGQVTLNQT